MIDLPKRAIVFLIRRLYQPVSRTLWRRTCKFVPTCSEYAAQAIAKYGCIKGAWLAACRIVRCNPWSEGGDDPLK